MFFCSSFTYLVYGLGDSETDNLSVPFLVSGGIRCPHQHPAGCQSQWLLVFRALMLQIVNLTLYFSQQSIFTFPQSRKILLIQELKFKMEKKPRKKQTNKEVQQESKILYLSGQGNYWEGENLWVSGHLKIVDTLY